ncbi:hypothetical protein ACP4OV_015419 [Aristida adscensionis]
MVGADPDGGGGAPDICDLFCHYNRLYFRDSLGACAVCWTDDPLPQGDLGMCDYYPGGGGCMILLSKSLYGCRDATDVKNVLLHEMIHAYICVKDNNNNHSDHGTTFQKLMKAINLSSVADPLRPVGGYNITMLHRIREKCYHYKCEICGDLVKSSKLGGPSRDDCVERLGANDLCEHSNCHWHRHMKQCSGTYHRVESPESVQLKCLKAEESLDDGKSEEPVFKSRYTTRASSMTTKGNKHEREDTSAEFRHLTVNEAGCSGLDSSSRDKSSKKLKMSKDNSFELQAAETSQEAPKRTRTASLKKQECSSQKKKKLSKRGNSYSVIIEWLNYYCVSDSDEDEVPLINKRTERRKRQRLLEISQAGLSSNGDKCASSSNITNGSKDGFVGSCLPDSGDNSKSVMKPTSESGERLLPSHALDSHEVAEYEAGHEPVLSPMNSPIRGDIVDISDG